MTDTSISDVLSNYNITKDSELDRSFWFGQDIIIPKGFLANQDECTKHSTFSFVSGNTGYVAGISGLQQTSFETGTNDPNDCLNGYFYHTNNDLNDIVIDAEKSFSCENDLTLCWAATASNLLCRTGWLTPNVKDEDDIFNIFRAALVTGSTSTDGANPYDGIEWFLTGHYPSNGVNGSDQLNPYFDNSLLYNPPLSVTDLSNYLLEHSVSAYSYIFLVDAINELRAGNAVGLVVSRSFICNNNNNDENDDEKTSLGHVITLQGFTYQAADNPDEIKVTGIIIADSDDNMKYDAGNNHIGSSYAPNRLVVVPIHYMFGYIYLDCNYYSNCLTTPWAITYATVLKPAQFTTLSNAGVPVSRGASLQDKTIAPLMEMNVFSKGLANRTLMDGGSAHVFGGGKMILNTQEAAAGNVTLGGKMVVQGSINCNYLNIVYQLDVNTPENDPLITNLSNMGGVSTLGLNVNRMESFGNYTLASNGGNFNSNGTVVVTDITNNSSLLSLHDWSHSSCSAGAKTYTLDYAGGVMTLNISGTKADQTTPLSGTSEFQDEGIHDPDMRIVGGYDMDWDHRVDLVTCRSIEIDSTDCLVIEYAQSGDLNDVQEIDIINNSGNVNWNIYCGNLTGHDWKNSILWHAPDLGILGYWADAGGNASWGTIGNVYDSNWEVLGLGDFSNDSVHKDAVLFQYNCSAIVEITASGGYRSLGTLGSGWEVAAIGDFSNDGVDDLILYNTSSGMVGKWADGVDTGWSSLGTVGTGTSIEGAGDYDGNGTMDLLARQSDGTMGYYASANLSQFTSFGYTMDSSWTVIA